jgi:hypothetical protein
MVDILWSWRFLSTKLRNGFLGRVTLLSALQSSKAGGHMGSGNLVVRFGGPGSALRLGMLYETGRPESVNHGKSGRPRPRTTRLARRHHFLGG